MNKKAEQTTKNNNNGSIIKFVILVGIILILVAVIAIVIKGSDNTSHILKSEYNIHEVGYLDDIELILTDATYINNNTGIEINFKITNKRDNTITITPDDYFVFYDINKVQIPNKYTNNKNIIKKDETVNYKLQYDVTQKELYEIYFYSQVVENNVKFSFKSSDIKSNSLTTEDESINNTKEDKILTKEK